jgi:hypothetical protein
MEKKDLIGKEMLGFKFESGGSMAFIHFMEDFIGKKGKIISTSETSCSVRFPGDRHTWSYPYPQLIKHLVENQEEEEEIDLEELFKQIKNLKP